MRCGITTTQKGGPNVLLWFLVFVFMTTTLSAEITFFEGELGYRDDFFILPEQPVSEASEEAIPSTGLSGFSEKNIDPESICNSILDYSVEKEVFGTFTFSLEEKQGLLEIVRDEGFYISLETLDEFLSNYYETCDKNVLGNFFAAYSIKQHDIPLIISVIIILIVTLLVLIIYFRVRSKKNRGKKKKR